MDSLKELRRRLIVIPTKKVEELSDTRKLELGIMEDDYQDKLIDIDNIDWKGFTRKFNEFWDLERADIYLTVRASLVTSLRKLNSTERAISLDLIATGITTGIWRDEIIAVKELKDCFNWLKQDVKATQSPLKSLIESLLKQIETNALNGNTTPFIYAQQLRHTCGIWYTQGWLMDKPNNKEICQIMHEHGYRINNRGQWAKQ